MWMLKKPWRVNFRPFFALITTLSFTFTQAVPTFALRPEGGASSVTRAGLEERLKERAPSVLQTATIELDRPTHLRPIEERIQILEKRFGRLGKIEKNGKFTDRLTKIFGRLVQAVDEGILTPEEAADSLLTLALIAPDNRKLQKKAEKTVQKWASLCSNCGIHALHEAISGDAILLFGHNMLHLLAAVATASDLYLRNGDLPSVAIGKDSVDHGREIGRTVQTVAWLRSLTTKDKIVAGEVAWDKRTPGRLKAALGGKTAIALVSHPRTLKGQRQPNHYIRIIEVNESARKITYLDNGIRKQVSYEQFAQDHIPPSRSIVLLLTPDQIERYQNKGGSWRALKGRELTDHCGACGIIAQTGRYAEEGGLAAAYDAAYRGKDNTGEVVVDLWGVRKVAAKGGPTELVREFQLHGQGYPEEGMALYLEANPGAQVDENLKEALERLRDGQHLNEYQRFLIHRKWRSLTDPEKQAIERLAEQKARELLDAQGLGWVNPKAPEIKTKDELYQIKFYDKNNVPSNKAPGHVDMYNSIGRGKRGSVWSGRWFDVPSPQTEDWNGYRAALIQLIQDIQSYYRYDPAAIRDILSFEILGNAEQLQHVTPDKVAGSFRDIFDRVFAGKTDTLSADALEKWREAWRILSDKKVRVAGHVTADPVRHAFRLQERLIAAIRLNPVWRNNVQRRFIQGQPDQTRNWFKDWLVERATSTPGRAFTAITEWFQEVMMPRELVEEYGIELGYMDAFILGHMGVVDRVIRHDRWATTGSRLPKDAQPLTDTGLLSNLSDDELQELVDLAKFMMDLEIKRKQAKGESISDDEKSSILRQWFVWILEDYLEVYPQKKGTPQRAYVHNGDLSPIAHHGMMEQWLRPNGYKNRQRRTNLDGSQVVEEILTDTWRFVATHEFIYDQFRKDSRLGLVDMNTQQYKDVESPGFMPKPYRDLWNKIRSQRPEANSDEVARRIAAIEFAEGVLTAGPTTKIASEMAFHWVSEYDPTFMGVISHRRPVEIVVVRGKDDIDVQIQYTSDALTALRMFDPKEVAGKILEDQKISEGFKENLKSLLGRLNEQKITRDDFYEELVRLVAEYEVKSADLAEALKAELIVNLSGAQKYVKVKKYFNKQSKRFEVEFEITNFRGERLATLSTAPGTQDWIAEHEREFIQIKRNASVRLDVASKEGYRTFGEKEIASQPAALAQMLVAAGATPNNPTQLDLTREGLQQVDQQKQQALQQAGDAREVPPSKGGLAKAILTEFVRNVLQKGYYGTVLATGVGSSENTATAAAGLFRFLLPNFTYDPTTPARLLSTAATYNPDATLALLITWSGTTALTIQAGAWLRSQGVNVAGITGNPDAGDIRAVVENSAGTVWARTKKEVAIYTTVGFLMLTEAMFELAMQLNWMMQQQEGLSHEAKQELQRRLNEIGSDREQWLNYLVKVLDDSNRDITNEDSLISKAAQHFRNVKGFRIIGDYANNMILDEIGLKLGEVRNIAFSSYDVSSPRYRTAIESNPNLNAGEFLNATSAHRMKEFTEFLRWARTNKRSVIVQTFDRHTPKEKFANDDEWEAFQEFLKELDQLEQDFDGRNEKPLVVRFEVPKVHYTLQPFLDVITGQKFAVALAFQSGLPPEAIDGPRNLAKSVTVLGVSLVFGAYMTLQEFLNRYGSETMKREMGRFIQALRSRWSELKDPMDQGLHRLPLRMEEMMGAVHVQLDAEKLKESFGQRLENLKKMVIVYDTDDAAEVAGRMASTPLSYRETVLSDTSEEKLFQKMGEVKLERVINGKQAVIEFRRSKSNKPDENRVAIYFKDEAGKIPEGKKPAFVFYADERSTNESVRIGDPSEYESDVAQYDAGDRTLTLAGKRYQLNLLGKKGIALTAVLPDLLGVPVVIRHVADLNLDTELTPGSLLVVLNRSNHRGDEEAKVVSIQSASGRSDEEKKRVSARGISETRLAEFLRKQSQEKRPIVVITDDRSIPHPHATHGSIQLPVDDLDANLSVLAYYTSLILLGARLGDMKNILLAKEYERALQTIPVLLAKTLESLYRDEAETGSSLFSERDVVRGVTVALGHKPYTFRYRPGSGSIGTVEIFSGDREGPIATIEVDVSQRKLVDARQQEVTLDGRPYRVVFDSIRGLVLTSVQPDYQGGGTIRDRLVSLRQNRANRQYTTWGVIGGVQDRASAAAIALALEQAGFQAKHLEVDESVHGFYALIHDTLEKFSRNDKSGVSPNYDSDNPDDLQSKDVGLIILATDSRVLSAAIVDVQRAVTRGARVILVVKEQDRNLPAVVKSGAYLILTVPDSINDLTSVSNELVGRVIARELVRSKESEFDYQERSPWARLAELPYVELRTEAEGAERIPYWTIARLAKHLTEKEGDRLSVNDVDEFVNNLYRAYRSKSAPVAQRVRGPKGIHSVFAVFPFNKESTVDPTLDIPQRAQRLPGKSITVTHIFFDKTFRENPERQETLASLRLQVNTLEEAEGLVQHIAELIAPYKAVSTQPPIVLDPKDAIHTTIQRLEQKFEAEGRQGIYFESTYDSENNQTILAVIGERHQPGLLNAITGPLTNASISFEESKSVSDHADIDYVTVKGRVSEDVLNSIKDKVAYLTPLHFSNMVKEKDRTLTSEMVDTLYTTFRNVHESGQPVVIRSESAYPGEQSDIIVAMPDASAPPDVVGSIQSKIESAGPNILGEVSDISYKGVRLIWFTIDVLETSRGAKAAEEAVRAALGLKPGAAPSAGMEEREEEREEADRRRWTWDETEQRYQTPEGGLVLREAFRKIGEGVWSIDSTAKIQDGAWVSGENTRIEANVEISRSLVQDAVIKEGAKLYGAVVMTDPNAAEDWAWNDTYKVDKVLLTEIGKAVVIGTTEDGEPTFILNAKIGDNTEIYGSAIKNSDIGKKNLIYRAKIGLTHTEDNVTIKTRNGAPTEVSESWIGWGRTIDTESYNEHLSPNFIIRAYVDETGEVQFRMVEDIPAVVIQGYSTLDASYDGTGKVGKEFTSSRHGKGIKFPAAIIGPRVNTIMLVHPDFSDPMDFFRAESLDRNTPYAYLTALHPSSYSRYHRDPQKGEQWGEVWGLVAPGSARWGLSPRYSDSLFIFEKAQRAMKEILDEMHRQVDRHADTDGWDDAKRNAVHAEVDMLPLYALETGKALARLAQYTELEGRYEEYLKLYEAGQWPKDEGMSLAQLLATDDVTGDGENDWVNRPLWTDSDVQALGDLPQGVEISPDSQIGEGARIVGARARLVGVTVPANATVSVWNSSVERTTLENGVHLANTAIRESTVGSNSRISNTRAERSTFGASVEAVGAVVLDSTVGDKSTLEAYARLDHVVLGPKGTFGSIAEHSQFGKAVTSHHLVGTRLSYVRTPDYTVTLPDGRTVTLPNLTNISSGVRAKGTEDAPVVLHTTMTGANMTIHKGAQTDFGSFVKNVLGANENVEPFSFSSGIGDNAKAKGWTVSKMPNMVMRLVLGKTIKETSDQDRPAVNDLMQQMLDVAQLPDQRDGRWEMAFDPGSDKPVFTKGEWKYKPAYPGEREGNGQYEWVAKAQAEAGMEELPAVTIEKLVGVIAGPTDKRALVVGVALHRKVYEERKTFEKTERRYVPVAFIVESQAEAEDLKKLGIGEDWIFKWDERSQSLDAVVKDAKWKIWEHALDAEVIELGVYREIPNVAQIFRNLFGIQLDAAGLESWERAIEDLTLAFQA